ncbi:MAG: DEAD/DEAH box helicase [Treponemataceae bacterium]|nr:DEAD/DEAH box helicase [Treponemataceae bacterium]
MNFTELSLDEMLLKGIAEAGYETCTPVQEQVLCGAQEGADLYVQSQTGTGKTAAYLITILQQILANKEKGKKALVMVPTRELAVQVEEEASTLAKYTGLKSASFYGGVGYEKQKQLLENGVDILIGTPGRVIDLLESGSMKLDNVGFLVIDEADRMFDMGFYPDLRKLIKLLPGTTDRQTMLFSATLNTYVKNLAWEYTEDAKEITIECENITVSEIDQLLYHVSSDDKMKLLLGILTREKPESVIIFCNTKRSSEVISKRLEMNGFESEFIIGDLPQSKRLQVINSFKSGKLKCLVATDVAARGIDVDDLAMVVNFDLPNEAENYVHRIGRTARAGKTGKAYTFCSEQDVYNLPAIERYIEMSVPSEVADETLFAEDKSAGTYIKTGNYYEDERGEYRGRGRDSRHGERRDGGRNGHRDGNRSGYKKTGYKGDNFAKGERRSNYKNDQRFDKSRRNFEQAPNNDAEKLSSMSFDERMKVYREKYGQNAGGTAAPAGDRPNRGKPNSQNGGKKYNGNKNRYGDKPQNGGAYKGKNNRNYDKSGKNYAKPNQTYAKNENAAKPKPAENQQPAKKGFLAKLKGIFGKK